MLSKFWTKCMRNNFGMQQLWRNNNNKHSESTPHGAIIMRSLCLRNDSNTTTVLCAEREKLPKQCRSRRSAQRYTRRSLHNWKRQMNYNEQRRKITPKLVYLHNPWKYLLTKFNLFKLKALWDREFNENDFVRGSKQAAVVLTNIIREQNASQISNFTTPIGFQQITRDMLLSRNDSRLKLVRFDVEHIRRAIPMKVATRSNFGRKYAFIDMLFVGLRNTKDFDTPEEVVEINEILRKLDADLKTPLELLAVPHRIVFAEIFMRFRRDYTNGSSSGSETSNQLHENDKDWSVSFYKILTFDVLNFDPKT